MSTIGYQKDCSLHTTDSKDRLHEMSFTVRCPLLATKKIAPSTIQQIAEIDYKMSFTVPILATKKIALSTILQIAKIDYMRWASQWDIHYWLPKGLLHQQTDSREILHEMSFTVRCPLLTTKRIAPSTIQQIAEIDYMRWASQWDVHYWLPKGLLHQQYNR